MYLGYEAVGYFFDRRRPMCISKNIFFDASAHEEGLHRRRLLVNRVEESVPEHAVGNQQLVLGLLFNRIVQHIKYLGKEVGVDAV
jgi:hypothetical protein